MFIIKKHVGKNIYYWNDEFRRWEDLYINATSVNNQRLDELMVGFARLVGDFTDYSFTKIY